MSPFINPEIDLDTLNEELRDSSAVNVADTSRGSRKGNDFPFPIRQLGPSGLQAGSQTPKSHRNSGGLHEGVGNEQYMNDVMELNSKLLDYNNNFNKTFA